MNDSIGSVCDKHNLENSEFECACVFCTSPRVKISKKELKRIKRESEKEVKDLLGENNVNG